MYLQTYDTVTGSVISDRASELDFGDVLQGRHCTNPVLIRILPDVESTITDMSAFLGNDGGWSSAEFGYYVNPTFIPEVQAGSDQMNNHFVVATDATAGTPGGVALGTTDGTSDYLWLDIDLPTTQTGSTAVTYRFVFNYS